MVSRGKSGGSQDPNDKTGPGGDGSASQYIPATKALNYSVAFENQPTATLPASQVNVCAMSVKSRSHNNGAGWPLRA